MPIDRINDHVSDLAIRTGKGTSAHPELVEPEATEGQRLGVPGLRCGWARIRGNYPLALVRTSGGIEGECSGDSFTTPSSG